VNVRQLIDFLSDQDPEAEVELAIVAPVDDDVDDITVDRYEVDAVMPWDRDENEPAKVWLVGGEEDDVDAFIDAVEDDSEHDHEHD
jgi:hypothetical protein